MTKKTKIGPSRPSKKEAAAAIRKPITKPAAEISAPAPAPSLPAVTTVKKQPAHPAPLKTVREAGRPPNHLTVERAGDETPEETDARLMGSAAALNSFTTRFFGQWISPSTTDAVMAHDVVAAKIAAVQAGDMTEIEAMLVGSACGLQVVATEFLRRASLCITNPTACETYMRIGLRATAQMRANCEAVAEIKNPRPVFARQTNIANGTQQVNNTAGPQQVNNGTTTKEGK